MFTFTGLFFVFSTFLALTAFPNASPEEIPGMIGMMIILFSVGTGLLLTTWEPRIRSVLFFRGRSVTQSHQLYSPVKLIISLVFCAGAFFATAIVMSEAPDHSGQAPLYFIPAGIMALWTIFSLRRPDYKARYQGKPNSKLFTLAIELHPRLLAKEPYYIACTLHARNSTLSSGPNNSTTRRMHRTEFDLHADDTSMPIGKNSNVIKERLTIVEKTGLHQVQLPETILAHKKRYHGTTFNWVVYNKEGKALASLSADLNAKLERATVRLSDEVPIGPSQNARSSLRLSNFL